MYCLFYHYLFIFLFLLLLTSYISVCLVIMNFLALFLFANV